MFLNVGKYFNIHFRISTVITIITKTNKSIELHISKTYFLLEKILTKIQGGNFLIAD